MAHCVRYAKGTKGDIFVKLLQPRRFFCPPPGISAAPAVLEHYMQNRPKIVRLPG